MLSQPFHIIRQKMNLLVASTLIFFLLMGFSSCRMQFWSYRSFEDLTAQDLETRALSVVSYARHGRCQNRETRMAIARNANCRPRSRAMQLAHPEGIKVVSMVPKYVEVMQCDGGDATGTNLAHECLPVTTRRIQIPVFIVHTGRQSECGTVEVEEHVTCRMGCRIQSTDCLPPHVYSADRCRCQCPNQMEAFGCSSDPENLVWDQSRCRCFSISSNAPTM